MKIINTILKGIVLVGVVFPLALATIMLFVWQKTFALATLFFFQLISE